MRKIIFTYGLISGGIIIISTLGTISIWNTNQHFFSEWLGYLVMIVALSLVFFGIKSYRDNQQGGVINFKTALGIGLGISLVASVIYTTSWEIYFQNSDSSFMDNYEAHYIRKMEKDGATVEEIANKKSEIAEWRELSKNPLVRIGITFTEIIPVGILISLIAAGILRRSEILPGVSGSET